MLLLLLLLAPAAKLPAPLPAPLTMLPLVPPAPRSKPDAPTRLGPRALPPGVEEASGVMGEEAAGEAVASDGTVLLQDAALESPE